MSSQLAIPERSFEIEPSGDGWRLQLFEGPANAEIPMGGGWFPNDDYCDAIEEGEAWTALPEVAA